MARTIMDVIQEQITPTSTSNAIVETMMDWRRIVMEKESAGSAGQRYRLKVQRNTIEKVLAHFLGIRPDQVRALLADHYGMAVDRGE